MKKFFFLRLLSMTTVCLLLLASCTKGGEQKTVRVLKTDSGFRYSEDIPFGTSFDDALELYWDETLDSESQEYESWRIGSTATQQVLIPNMTELFYGRDWQCSLTFDREDGLIFGSYYTRVSEDEYPKVFETIVQDCYDIFGEGDLPKEQLLELLADAGTGSIVQNYWTAEDGTYFALAALINSKECTIELIPGVMGTVNLTSGSKKLPAFSDQLIG